MYSLPLAFVPLILAEDCFVKLCDLYQLSDVIKFKQNKQCYQKASVKLLSARHVMTLSAGSSVVRFILLLESYC